MLEHDSTAYQRDCTTACNKRFAVGIPVDQNLDDIWIGDGILFIEPTSILLIDRAFEDRENSYGHSGFGLVAAYRGNRLTLSLNPASAGGLAAGLGQSVRRLAEMLKGNATFAENGSRDGIDGWWSTRIESQASAQRVEAALRTMYEGALLRDGAIWVTPERCNQSGELRAKQALAQASGLNLGDTWIIQSSQLKDLEPSQEVDTATGRHNPAFLFKNIRLRSSLGKVLHAAAVESIGKILWAEIRPDDRPGTPVGYEANHRQGDSGLITVWTRRGIAVACSTEDADEKADRIAHRLRDIENVSRQAAYLQEQLTAAHENPTPPRQADELLHAEERLLESYASLESKASTPEWRLLRRLLSATQQMNTVKALLDHRTAASQLATSVATADLQAKLEWLELIIVSFYAFEFSRAAFEGAFDGSWRWAELALPAFLGALIFLVAHHCVRQNKPSLLLRSVAGLTIVVIVCKIFIPYRVPPTREIQIELIRTREQISSDLRRLVDAQIAGASRADVALPPAIPKGIKPKRSAR